MPQAIFFIIFKLYTFFSFLFKKKTKSFINKNEIKNILLIELTKMGDVLVTFPAVRILREEFLNANIDFLVDPFVNELVNFNTDINFCHSTENSKSLIGILKTILRIRKKKYDLALSMSPSFRNALVSLFCNARYKTGYLEGVGSKSPFLRDNIISSIGFSFNKNIIFKRGENIYSRPLKVLEALGLKQSMGQYIFNIPDKHMNSAAEFFSEFNINLQKNIIVIQPFAPWKYRSWPPQYFSSLINKIYDYFDIEIVLIGSLTEKKQIESIVNDIVKKPILLTGKPLTLVAGIIKNASLYIGNDSGPIHLAHALGTSVIGLYGPVSPEITGPINRRNNFFYKQVECSPCDQEYCRRPDNYCMSLISVKEVFSAVEEIIGKSDFVQNV